MMKKISILAGGLCLVFVSAAAADILTPWDLLRRRPETSEFEVVIPDPVSADVVSSDSASGDVPPRDSAGKEEQES